jgi:pyrimidine-nucleoside phosphorylase
MNCTEIGWAVQRLGAGRARPGDPVSAHAGIEMHAKVGDRVLKGQVIATLFSEEPRLLAEPEQMLRDTLQISPKQPQSIPLVREVIRKEDLR